MAGNQGNNRIIWQDWQIKFLKENFYSLSAQELSNALGITKTVVRYKYYELGLKKMELQYWTEEQTAYLINNYKHKGDTELAQIFNEKWHKPNGWTKKHIEKKRRRLKLKHTSSEQRKIKDVHVQNGVYSRGNIKKWETRGSAKFGDLRVWSNNNGRAFVVIKIKHGFVHYARWLYEQTFGQIPNGMVVRLKDNNYQNVTIQNLMLVSRREHAKINKTNADPAFTTARKLIHLIKKTTLKHEKQISRLEQPLV
jgi:hypothetical protein